MSGRASGVNIAYAKSHMHIIYDPLWQPLWGAAVGEKIIIKSSAHRSSVYAWFPFQTFIIHQVHPDMQCITFLKHENNNSSLPELGFSFLYVWPRFISVIFNILTRESSVLKI